MTLEEFINKRRNSAVISVNVIRETANITDRIIVNVNASMMHDFVLTTIIAEIKSIRIPFELNIKIEG